MVQYCPMIVLAWQANNIKSTSKRAVASATTLIGSGIGGMVSGGAFKTSESPLYQVRLQILSSTWSLAYSSDVLLLLRPAFTYLWDCISVALSLLVVWSTISTESIRRPEKESVGSKIWTIGITHTDRTMGKAMACKGELGISGQL